MVLWGSEGKATGSGRAEAQTEWSQVRRCAQPLGGLDHRRADVVRHDSHAASTEHYTAPTATSTQRPRCQAHMYVRRRCSVFVPRASPPRAVPLSARCPRLPVCVVGAAVRARACGRVAT